MTPDEIAQAHRRFAVECNNRAWDLASQASRTPAEAQEMVFAAHAAAFHWAKIGAPINFMRADLLLAHTHALAGSPAEALRYAERVLHFCQSNPCEDWDLAFAYATVAFAAFAGGDNARHRQFYALAEAQGPAIKDKEDREVFLAEFAQIPRPRE